VLAADEIANAAKDDGAEGPDQEAGRIGHERREERRRIIAWWKELLCEEWCENSVKVKVIPFKDRSQRRGKYNPRHLGFGYTLDSRGRVVFRRHAHLLAKICAGMSEFVRWGAYCAFVVSHQQNSESSETCIVAVKF